MLKIADPLKIILRSLRSGKTRFLLTVLGIIIGVAAVILVMAIGASAQRLILSQVERVGSNLIAVLPGASEERGPPAQAFGVVTTTLKNSDLKALRERRNVPHLVAASGYVTGAATLESLGETIEATYQGVSPDLIAVEALELEAGRFFYKEEESNLARVMVLGSTRANDLFPNQNPIGETVKMQDVPFKVVGVLKERGGTAFSNPDTLVYIPLETAQKILLGIDYLNFIRGKVDAPYNVDRTVADVYALLNDRHNIEAGEESDFSVRNTATALGILTNITNVLKYFLIAIASISLIVGGIGIMNSMLIVVNQRIREVGLRKAVGARPVHIATQFLIESASLAIFGGIVGIVIGVVGAYLASIVIIRLGYEWELLIPLSSLGLGVSISLIVGLIFGSYPAWKAARISPMEALRYE